MNVKEKVLDILSNNFSIDRNIDTSLPLLKVGIDSIKLMMLIVNLEEEFNIEFNDDVLVGKLNSIDALCKVLEGTI